MPLTSRDPGDGGLARNRKLKAPKKPKAHKGSKGHGGKGRGHKGHKPPKPKTVHPAKWHESASHPAGATTRATSGSMGTPHLAGSALPAWLLRPGPSGVSM